MKNTKTLVLIVLMLFAFTLSAQKIQRDTINDFSNPPSDNVIFKSPKGKFYKVNFMPEAGHYIEAEATLSVNCSDSTFAGSARKAAKTSIVTAKTEDLATVSAMIKTFPKDAVMRTKVTSSSKRVPDENRNVRLLKDTYLYAFKKESDNDYHVIIGDNTDPKKATYFNVEISGLPVPNDKRFKAVRAAFEKQFVQVCAGSYAIFSANPIKIAIEGSVFFDVDHKPGQIGPAGFQPLTTWEIHPITKITFLK